MRNFAVEPSPLGLPVPNVPGVVIGQPASTEHQKATPGRE